MSDYNDFGAVIEPVCPRCGIGIDDDGDGDCTVCASASNKLVTALVTQRNVLAVANKQLHETILLLDAAKKSHASTVEEYLRRASLLVQNTLRGEKLLHCDRLKLAMQIVNLKDTL